MGMIQRLRDARRRQKATEVKQEIANNLIVNPLCSDYENVFAQVQPLINDMKMVKPFGVGKNGGRLPSQRTPELELLNSPNDEMGWGEFAGSMFATWLTEDELDIHVHMERNRVLGYSILPPNSKVYLGNGDYYFQIYTDDGAKNLSREEVMSLRFSRSPKNLQRGISPATAVRAWAQAEDVLAQYERAYIENGAIPASITFIRASSFDKFNSVRKEMEGNLKGASNHGKTVYVWRQFNNDTGESLDQVEVKTIQGNNSTLAIKELTDIINDHLNKAYGVSNFILGDDSSAKYDNAELSDYQFIKRRVFPALMAFWDQFQFELDRVTGGLGYAIQFELELPDLTERQKVRAEIARMRAETLRGLIDAGAGAKDAVKALNLGDEWLNVARGIQNRVLTGTIIDKQTSDQNEKHAYYKPLQNIQEHSSCSCQAHSLKLNSTAPVSTVDELPPMTEDERKIYDALVAMAERIFASSPDIKEEEVIDEIIETLDNEAKIGGSAGADEIIKLLKNEDVAAEIKADLANMDLSNSLRERISGRTRELVTEYGKNTKDLLDETLKNSKGLSAAEIRKELRAILPTYQAERIARTETVYAYKSGRLDEDEQIADKYGLTIKLKWHARHDNQTCNVCAAMDGVETTIGVPFTDHRDIPVGTTLVNGYTIESKPLEVSWVQSHWNDDGTIPAPHPNCRCYFNEIVEAE